MGWNAGYAAMEASVIAVYDGIGALPRLAIESCCAKPVLVYLLQCAFLIFHVF